MFKVKNKKKFFFLGRFFFYNSFSNSFTLLSFLKKFYGIGFARSIKSSIFLGRSLYVKLKNVSPFFFFKLHLFFKFNFLLERELKILKEKVFKRYQKEGFYKGLRYQQGMPLRGQRTHSNAKTSRKKLHY